MKKLLTIFLGILFLASCATVGTDQKIVKLEKRVDQLEMMIGAGVGANFYPFRCLTGGAAGCLDSLGEGSVVDKDVAFVMLENDGTFGNAVLMYVLNDASACGGDDIPWYIQPDGAVSNDCWELVNVYGSNVFGGMKVSAQTAASPTVNDYDSGTYFFNADNDAIQFNLPAAAVNLIFCFGNSETGGTPIDQIITIEPNGTDHIILDGDDSGAGINIASTGDGQDGACIVGVASGYWKVTGYTGTWAVGS